MALLLGGAATAQGALAKPQQLYDMIGKLGEQQQREQLDRAAALCDDAAKEAGEGAVVSLRDAFAKLAFERGHWDVAVKLYDALVHYCEGAYQPAEPYRLQCMRGLAIGLRSQQEAKESAARDYRRAIQLLREVQDQRDRMLAAAVAQGSGPLRELADAADARRELATTLRASGDDRGALSAYDDAEHLLRKHIDRLDDPRLLRLLSSDCWELRDTASNVAATESLLQLLRAKFPERLDLALSLEIEVANALSNQGREAEALSSTMAVLEKLPGVMQWEDERDRAYVLRIAGQRLHVNDMTAQAEGLVRKAIETLRTAGVPENDADLDFDQGVLVGFLIDRGALDDALSLISAIRTNAPGRRTVLGLEVRARRLYGDTQGTLEALEAMTTEVESNQGLWIGNSASHRQASALRLRNEIAQILIRTGQVERGLRRLEDLRARVEREPLEALPLDEVYSWLADAHAIIGDYVGAHGLQQENLRLTRARLGPDEHELLATESLVAAAAFAAGAHAAEETHARRVRDALQRLQQTERPLFAQATVNLAEALAAQSRWQDAEPLAREGLELARQRQLVHLAGNAQAVLGVILLARAETEAGVEALRDGIETMSAVRGGGDPATVAWYRGKLLPALAKLHLRDQLHAEINSLRDACKAQLRPLTALSAQERGNVLQSLIVQAEQVASLDHAERLQALTDRDLLEWFATMRAMAGPTEVARRRGIDRAKVGKLFQAAQLLRSRVAAVAADTTLPPATRERLLREAEEGRNRAEGALLEALPPGTPFAWITATDVAAKLLPFHAVAIAIHRIHAAPPHQPTDHFLGFRVDERGEVLAVDLGDAATIAKAADDWRAMVTGSTRGRPASGGQDLDKLGQQLRKSVLDPVLGDSKAERVFACLDDVLNTIPWDALPDNDKSLVGDHRRFAVLPSLRDLLDHDERPHRQPQLVLFGDIDYDAEGKASSGAPPADRPPWSGDGLTDKYTPLVAAKDELDAIASLAAKNNPALRRDKAAATKAALFELAPKATVLHLCTHGYFSDDSVRAMGDAPAVPGLPAIGGLPAMTLCGLALAGANRKVGALDEVTGIVTAEELAGLDLAGCELAVLSACQSSLGTPRTGLGLASLQAALHAAGAAATVTSLWRVPDAMTKELMQRFYRNLWGAGGRQPMPPDEALWQAQLSLRNGDAAARHPVAWAGWVFSGVPARIAAKR